MTMKQLVLIALLTFPYVLSAQQQDSLLTWFKKMEWFKSQTIERTYDAFGRVIEEPVQPALRADLKADSSVNIAEFSKQYNAHPERWNKAFAYLRNTNFQDLSEGKYEIDGMDVYALVTTAPPKSADSTPWEAHKNYDDIHYVISGKEKIGIAPLASAKAAGAYNADRDLTYYAAKGNYHLADPGIFIIITAKEVHQPGIKADRDDIIKKLCIKVRRN